MNTIRIAAAAYIGATIIFAACAIFCHTPIAKVANNVPNIYLTKRNLSVGEKELYFYQQLPCVRHDIYNMPEKGRLTRSTMIKLAAFDFLGKRSHIYDQQSPCLQTGYIDLFAHYNIESPFTTFFARLDGCQLHIQDSHGGNYTSNGPLRFIDGENKSLLQLYKEQVVLWMTTANIVIYGNTQARCVQGDRIDSGFIEAHLLMQELGLF